MRNSCDFQFNFDKPDRIYEAGESVTGTLLITPKRNIRCNALKLELRWRTHGQGNRAQGKVLPLEVDFYEAEVKEGQTYELPFSFLAPPGPLTYHGKYINIDWYLKATLDAPLTPGFLDPSGETEILLLPKEGEAIIMGPNHKTPVDPKHFASVSWGSAIFGLLFVGIGVIVGFVILNSRQNSLFSFFGLFPLAFTTVGLWVTYSAFQNFLAGSKMTDLSIIFEQRKFVPGDTVTASLTFQPRSNIKIDKITMTLTGIEQVVRGSGSNRKTFTETIFTESQELMGAQIVFPSEEVNLSGQLNLPMNAPYSFAATDNEIKWSVKVLIDSTGPLDWSQDYQIDVVPWKAEQYHDDIAG